MYSELEFLVSLNPIHQSTCMLEDKLASRSWIKTQLIIHLRKIHQLCGPQTTLQYSMLIKQLERQEVFQKVELRYFSAITLVQLVLLK